MIETLDRLDGELLLWLNSMHSAYFDNFMWIATGRWIWIPLYIAILLVLLRSQGWRRTIVWLVAVAVTITLADQICATWLRPEFARYRPANLLNPISDNVHIVNDYRGGRYGFPSCHGANSFALFALLAPVVKRRAFTVTLLLWAILNCYTRIYLGVHYPGDILTGAAIGACCGLLVYAASTAIIRRYHIKPAPCTPAALTEEEAQHDVFRENYVYLQGKKASDYGERTEQDNDGLSAHDGSGVATDSAGGVEGDRDRSDIRVYEEGLASGTNEYSGGSERARRESESARLTKIARREGQYIPREQWDALGEHRPKRSGESEVYDNHQVDGRIYKVKNPYAKSSMKGGVQPEEAIYEHFVHNKYFPETAYRFEGISDESGDVRIVLSQEFVESVDTATDEQVAAALAARGLMPEGSYSFGNDEITVTDVTGDNALVGADGNVYFIDPIINFKRPAREILGDVEAEAPADKVVEFTPAVTNIEHETAGSRQKYTEKRSVKMPDEYIAVTAGALLLIIIALVAACQTI